MRKRLVDRFGAAGIAAVGMLLFCAAFYWAELAPLRRELAAAQSAAAGPSIVRPVVSVEGNELGVLQSRFPPLHALTRELERLHRLGRAAGLQLDRAEYRLERQPAGLASYSVSLPVRGEYRALRQFMGSVLEEMPAASIDRLRFERKKPGDTQLDAHIHLTLFLRPEM